MWDAWFERQGKLAHEDGAAMNKEEQGPRLIVGDTGKGKAKDVEVMEEQGSVSGASDRQDDSLIIFSCRHIWHRGCVNDVLTECKGAGEDVPIDMDGSYSGLRCPLEV